jgi:hypothetical protein
VMKPSPAPGRTASPGVQPDAPRRRAARGGGAASSLENASGPIMATGAARGGRLPGPRSDGPAGRQELLPSHPTSRSCCGRLDQ